ncbi:MAG: neutral/alkaline non-lysosomal ceramidase N-terminal domain-containing protein [Phycisphaerae bacterium]|jgi:hypothetical protein
MMMPMLWVVLSVLPAAEPLSAGVASVDITPPVGYRMSGYFYERPSTGVRDPLQAKCLVLSQGGQRAAVVFCDLIGVSREVADAAREAAGRRTGIPPAHVAVAGTHTHSGPLYFGPLHAHFHRLAVQAHGRDPTQTVDYPALLTERIVESIVRAKANLRPVLLSAGSAEVAPTPAFNRRYLLKDGSVRSLVSPLDPNVVRPVGPIDPRLDMLFICEADGAAPIALLSSFALHAAVTGGTAYSADYPGHLEKTLRGAFGPGFVSLFGAGCCGDVNHVDVSRQEQRTAEQIGTQLGETARQAIGRLDPVRGPRLAVRQERVELALQQYSPQEMAKAEKDMAAIGGKDLPFLEQVKASKLTALRLLGRSTLTVDVQAVRISDDVAIVTLPGEIFVELGLAIKKASPFKTTFVIELANAGIHYVPTRRAFAEGGYETVNCIIEPGGGEKLVEAAIRLLEELGG